MGVIVQNDTLKGDTGMKDSDKTKKIWEKITDVNCLLEDELSQNIFERKIEWLFFGKDQTADLLYDVYVDSRIPELECAHGKNAKYAIAGAGKCGEKTFRALMHAGFQVACFLDNDAEKQGKKKFGIPVVSFTGLQLMEDDIIVILDNSRLQDMFYRELLEIGYSPVKIYLSQYNIVRTAFGNIYYDLPELKREKEEVFIDCGGFNGDSTKEFIKWCEGEYKKIYVIEPMAEGIALTKANLDGVRDTHLVQCALGSQDGEASFSKFYGGMKGSRLGSNGDDSFPVAVRSIDSILNGGRATFIKMDIEGAELSALKGAVNTLKTYKPKLAISLYHKKEDIIDIPLFIKSIVPEYKFYLRHYSNKKWDLVLYCIAD